MLVGARTREQQAVVGRVRGRTPHLLAVDPPPGRRLLGPRAHRGQIGAGARLGEQLRPYVVAEPDGFQVARLLLVAAELDQDRPDQVDAGDAELTWHPGTGALLGEDRLEGDGRVGAAVLDRPVQADVPMFGKVAVPGPAGFDVAGRRGRPVVAQTRRFRRVLQKRVDLRPKCGGVLGGLGGYRHITSRRGSRCTRRGRIPSR